MLLQFSRNWHIYRFLNPLSEEVYHKRKLSSELKEIVRNAYLRDTTNIIEKIPGLEEIGEILDKVEINIGMKKTT